MLPENGLDTYEEISNGIKITVSPFYLEDQSNPEDNHYVWAYSIDITNLGDVTVQLTDRHWRITDAEGREERVDGPGVVGEQPILNPGDTFQYTSGCPLTTPSGIMVGHYDMRDQSGVRFEVQIPAFSLDLPGARTIVN